MKLLQEDWSISSLLPINVCDDGRVLILEEVSHRHQLVTTKNLLSYTVYWSLFNRVGTVGNYTVLVRHGGGLSPFKTRGHYPISLTERRKVHLLVQRPDRGTLSDLGCVLRIRAHLFSLLFSNDEKRP